MACAFSLLCWHLIGPCRLNVYYVTSSNGIKLCDYKHCFLVRFYGHVSVIYHITKSPYPKLCLAYQNLCTYVLLVLIFQAKVNEGRLSYVYLSVSLINQVFVIHSFTILHRLMHLCFKWVVLDPGDSRMWIIVSLIRLKCTGRSIWKPV